MTDNHSLLDPELANVLAQIPMSPQGVFDLGDIPATRVAVRAFAEAYAAQTADDPTVGVEEHSVPAPDAPEVPIRLLRRRNGGSEPQPAVLWFHGGGQVLGYAAQDDGYLKRLCTAVGCIAVAVDYRLAPETPAPGAAADGVAVYRWVLEHADELGVDASRVGLAGASGGGGIAAAVALMIRDSGLPTPLFQALNYPMLDDRNTTPSSHQITDLGIWDRRANLLAWQAILGEHAGGDVPAYAAPARADNLSGLPPTFIAVGDLDLFRDEDLDYAYRLRKDGTPVDLHLYAGVFHNWDVFAPTAAVTRQFFDAWYGFLTRHFATSSADDRS